MNKKAFALIFSLIVVVILAILGTATISRSISESRMAQRQLESAQAFWAAEAGIQKALWVVSDSSRYGMIDNEGWLINDDGDRENNFSNGNFQVQISGDALTKTIVGSGTAS